MTGMKRVRFFHGKDLVYYFHSKEAVYLPKQYEIFLLNGKKYGVWGIEQFYNYDLNEYDYTAQLVMETTIKELGLKVK
jgi:hypothetical protein